MDEKFIYDHQAALLHKWVDGYLFDRGFLNDDLSIVVQRAEVLATASFIISYIPVQGNLIVYVEHDGNSTQIFAATMNEEQVEVILSSIDSTSRWLLTLYKQYINTFLRGDDES